MARIDPRYFKVARHQAQSDVAAAYATIADKQAALQVQQTVIAGARATVAVDQATERFAEQDNQRYATLAKDGWGTVQKAQEAASRIAAAHAAVARDAAALANAAPAGRRQPADRRGCIEVLGKETNETPWASKISTSLAKSASERVRAVDLVDDDEIDPSRANVGKQPLHSWAVEGSTRKSAIVIVRGRCLPPYIPTAGGTGELPVCSAK